MSLADLLTQTTSKYLVMHDGRVFSQHNWRGNTLRELVQRPNADGYLSVRLMVDGKRRHIAVHRLVAAAYLPAPEPGQQLRHLDGDKTHNHVRNLAWGTPVENAADREQHGRTARGERNGNSRLTEQQVREIRARLAAGEPQPVIAEAFGVSSQNVSAIHRRETWRGVA